MDNNGIRVPNTTSTPTSDRESAMGTRGTDICSSPSISSPPSTPGGGGGGSLKSNKGHHTLIRSLAVVADDDDDGLGCPSSNEGSLLLTETSSQSQQPLAKSQENTGLINFIKETINKNTKDRHLILRTESELVQFINSGSPTLPLPGPYSSYQRLIIHRVAAYFRLEHNIDSTGSGLVIGIGEHPLPESERIRFRDLITGQTKEDGGRGTTIVTSNTRPNHHHRKFRSLEQHQPTWTTGPARSTSGNQRILKGSSFEGSETRHQPPHPYVAKAYSFGGYQGQSKGGTLSTQTSLSPASSGYKSTSFPSMELRTPSPQSFETVNLNTSSSTNTSGLPVSTLPELQIQQHQSQSQLSSQQQHQQSEQQQQQQLQAQPPPLVLFAVSDIKSVPPGAVLIDPTTLSPMIPRYDSMPGGGNGPNLSSAMVIGTNLPPSSPSGTVQVQSQGPGLLYQQQPQYYTPIVPQAQPTFLPQPTYFDPSAADVSHWFAGMNLGMGLSHQGQYFTAPSQQQHPQLISSAAPQANQQHPGLQTAFMAPSPYNYNFYSRGSTIGPGGPFVRFCYPQPQQPYTTIQPTGLIFQPQAAQTPSGHQMSMAMPIGGGSAEPIVSVAQQRERQQSQTQQWSQQHYLPSHHYQHQHQQQQQHHGHQGSSSDTGGNGGGNSGHHHSHHYHQHSNPSPQASNSTGSNGSSNPNTNTSRRKFNNKN